MEKSYISSSASLIELPKVYQSPEIRFFEAYPRNYGEREHSGEDCIPQVEKHDKKIEPTYDLFG